MALRAGPRQRFTVSVGAGPTFVGFVKNTFGAKMLKIFAHTGPNANAFSFTSLIQSHNGVDEIQPPYNTLAINSGTGVTNTGAAAQWIVQAMGSDGTTPCDITCNFVKLFAAFAVAGGPVIIDVWPIYEIQNPAIPVGQDVV